MTPGPLSVLCPRHYSCQERTDYCSSYWAGLHRPLALTALETATGMRTLLELISLMEGSLFSIGVLTDMVTIVKGQWLSRAPRGFSGGSLVKNLPANAGDMGSIPGSGRSPGEGNDSPLQYSCLGNPMDRGAWWTAVHGVAKSWTQLNNNNHLIRKCPLGVYVDVHLK